MKRTLLLFLILNALLCIGCTESEAALSQDAAIMPERASTPDKAQTPVVNTETAAANRGSEDVPPAMDVSLPEGARIGKIQAMNGTEATILMGTILQPDPPSKQPMKSKAGPDAARNRSTPQPDTDAPEASGFETEGAKDGAETPSATDDISRPPEVRPGKNPPAQQQSGDQTKRNSPPDPARRNGSRNGFGEFIPSEEEWTLDLSALQCNQLSQEGTLPIQADSFKAEDLLMIQTDPDGNVISVTLLPQQAAKEQTSSDPAPPEPETTASPDQNETILQ